MGHRRQEETGELDQSPSDVELIEPRLAIGTRVMERVSARELEAESEIVQIVHDLKNPLSTIALELCLLEQRLRQLRETELAQLVTRISYNVNYLDRMVLDLLDSYAISAGYLQLRRRPTELRTLLEQVLERSLPTRDRARVILEAPDPITMSIDDLRIERVISNFVDNALKYAPAATGVVVRLDVRSDRVRISVTDSGPGMSTDESTCIFEKYGRTSHAHRYEGSGLGLYVSKQIIEAHGGRVGVDSIRGMGSRFYCDLPRT